MRDHISGDVGPGTLLRAESTLIRVEHRTFKCVVFWTFGSQEIDATRRQINC